MLCICILVHAYIYTYNIFFLIWLAYLQIVNLFCFQTSSYTLKNNNKKTHKSSHHLVKAFHCWSSHGPISTDDQNSGKNLFLDLASMWKSETYQNNKLEPSDACLTCWFSFKSNQNSWSVCFGFHRSRM